MPRASRAVARLDEIEAALLALLDEVRRLRENDSATSHRGVAGSMTALAAPDPISVSVKEATA